MADEEEDCIGALDEEDQTILLRQLLKAAKMKGKVKVDNQLHLIKEEIDEDLQSSTVKYRRSYNFDESSMVTFD